VDHSTVLNISPLKYLNVNTKSNRAGLKMSELNCATPDTPIQSILSKIENIFGALNQIVFENFTGSIDLFEADTFKENFHRICTVWL
jgi:hypothetical protein